MADRTHAFTVTVAAQTARTAPATTPLDFPEGIVRAVEVVIPDGVSGLAGWAFTYGGEWIIPYDRDTWVISNNEQVKWEVDNKPTGSQWALTAYNADLYNHTFYVRIHVDEFTAPLATTVLPVPITATT